MKTRKALSGTQLTEVHTLGYNKDLISVTVLSSESDKSKEKKVAEIIGIFVIKVLQ